MSVRGLAFALLLLSWSMMTFAANYPCSGRKGGVAHCSGAQFVCNDGSISGSKRHCSAELGQSSPRALLAPSRAGASAGDCSCRSGGVCTGPRGGQYCISDSGKKSYLKR